MSEKERIFELETALRECTRLLERAWLDKAKIEESYMDLAMRIVTRPQPLNAEKPE